MMPVTPSASGFCWSRPKARAVRRDPPCGGHPMRITVPAPVALNSTGLGY